MVNDIDGERLGTRGNRSHALKAECALPLALQKAVAFGTGLGDKALIWLAC
jgi:hypothetical protein